MKLGNDNYLLFLDDELFEEDEREIVKIDFEEGIIEFIYEKDHFPYWPSIAKGKIRLEKT
jgi:hypothetical protein